MLQYHLMKGLVESAAVGKPSEELKKTLMETFNVSYNEASRLVRTELSYIYNRSTWDKYKEAGIKQYRFLTAEDERTCEECSSLNNKVIDLDKAKVGKNYPPIHPNCRCTILAVIK